MLRIFLICLYYVLAACDAGTFASDGECEECPYGHYQPRWGQSVCLACPFETQTTDTMASTLESDCYFAYSSADGT